MPIQNTKQKDDDLIERLFIVDYAAFGLKINLLNIITLLEKARPTTDPLQRKSLCISGMQLLYSSYEDSALLLFAILARKTGRHLHSSLGVEREEKRKGTTGFPTVLKKYESARQVLDTLGLTTITLESFKRFDLDLSEEQVESKFREFAYSVRKLAEYQEESNQIKNRLKHGKAVFGTERGGASEKYMVYLTWKDNQGSWELHRNHLEVTVQQLEVATIHVAKQYVHNLDLLWFYMLHYYPSHVDDLIKIIVNEGSNCVKQVRELGLKSEGLTVVTE